MPGYVYRGTNKDAHEPIPKPRIGRPPKQAVCGTIGGYGKHQREKTPMCDDCRQANIDYCARRREERRQAALVYG